MKIVTKNALRIVRELTLLERSAVHAQFSVSNIEPTSYQTKIALEMASLAKASDAWIQCDCMPIENPAFLFPRQNESGTVTLVRPRPPRQNPHHPTCVFFLEDLPGATESIKQQVLQINDFCLLKPVLPSSKTTPNEDDDAAVRTVNELPRLTRILFDLLKDAGLNTINSHTTAYHQPFKSIYKSASQIPLWPTSQMKLSDVLTASKDISYFYMLINRLKTADFGKRRKQGYFITQINEFTESSITIGSTLVKVKGTIHAPSRVPKGPYWAIVLVGESKPDSNYFDALRVSIWPAYSEKLPFVVDSDPERVTLKELLSWRLYWNERGLDIFSITKPLNFSTMVRPDFLVQDDESGAIVVIETMGSQEPEYLQRKQSTHKEMQKMGPVIEHRVGDDSLKFKKLITAAIIK